MEQILKDRLVMIDKLSDKFDEDVHGLQELKTSNQEALVRNVYELEELMLEVMDFMSVYRQELVNFLLNGKYDFVSYNNKFEERDEQFRSYLGVLSEKEVVIGNFR